jgi:hypothetical protein
MPRGNFEFECNIEHFWVPDGELGWKWELTDNPVTQEFNHFRFVETVEEAFEQLSQAISYEGRQWLERRRRSFS